MTLADRSFRQAPLTARYALDVTAVVAGGFLVASALAFDAPVAGWLGFGVSTGVLVLAVAGAMVTRRIDARVAHTALGVVALWSLIAALIFTGTPLTWLVFADALAVAAVALVDLTLHEVSTERVVHEIDVRGAPRIAS